MPATIPAQSWPDLLRPGMTVYAPGCAGESIVLLQALAAKPARAAGVTFTGVWIPGVNRFDFAGLHPEARSRLFFLAPEFRESFTAGRADYLPIPYTAIFPLLTRTAIDIALLQVAPPDENGNCSLGIAADFTPAVMDRAKLRVAHVNPAMPRTAGAPTTPFANLDYVVEATSPILTYDTGGVGGAFEAIGRHIASLIDDGDTLQFGLGQVQGAVLRAIAHKKNLRIHSGMISDPVLGLLDAGAVADAPGAITTGVALGSQALYERAASDRRFRFAPVSHTHDISTLRAIENFVAINSTIEIDLFSQANAEMIGPKQMSGAGGLVDFLRGARLAKNGRAVIALQSTAKGGTVSRIVPQLDKGASVSIARGDAEIVITENGIADLRGKGIDARAEALIQIAAPAFRADLSAAWRDIRKNL
jgi:acyl-CoA hydrolase